MGIGVDYDDDDYDNDYDEDEEEGRSRQPQDWHQLVTCISDQVEEHNPLIGREQELDRTIQVLCRAEKNNPLHIGEPGVGKTALVYGLAKLINENQVPDRLKGARIYGMDMGQMLAGLSVSCAAALADHQPGAHLRRCLWVEQKCVAQGRYFPAAHHGAGRSCHAA